MEFNNNRSFRFGSLPIELRREVYRYLVVDEFKVIELESNYFNGDDAHSVKRQPIRFGTTRDLTVFEVSKQVQEEASEMFYNENVFLLQLWSTKRHYKCWPVYGMKCFHIAVSRIRKCHIRTLPGCHPSSFFENIHEQDRMRFHLQRIADSLIGKHNMRDLVIESFYFEVALINQPEKLAFSLDYMLEPLQSVRGIERAYIHCMRTSHWPYLRLLETEMTSKSEATKGKETANRPLWERASRLKNIAKGPVELEDLGELEEFAMPKTLAAGELYRLFDTKPLYRSTAFLDKYDEESDLL